MSSPTDDGKRDDDKRDDEQLDDEQLIIELSEELEVARCSFCGRSAFEVDRLVAQGGARICNICIKEFHGRLNPNAAARPATNPEANRAAKPDPKDSSG